MKEKSRKYPELPGVKTLLEKVRDGDQESFDPIYDFYKGRVKGYVRAKYYKDPSSIEDITQEVFLRAFLALKKGTLEPRDNLGGLLITMAKNQMLDIQKIKRTLPNAESGIEQSRDDVPQIAETNMRLERTIEAIKDLPPVHRQIISGSALGIPRVEIADSVGETPVYVHNNLHKIRARLKETVGENGHKEKVVFQRPRRVWFRGEPGFKPI